MSSYTGFSPKNPNRYVGPNLYLSTVVTRNRSPTGADYRQPENGKLYPIASYWIVGKNPTTGTEGDLWYLSKIVSNVANWVMLSAGVGSAEEFTVDSVTAPGVNPVSPNAGLIDFNGRFVAAQDIPVQSYTIALNQMGIEVQIGSAVAAPDDTKNGLSHYNSAQFTQDADGFVSLASSGAIATITGNSGVATPSSNNINIVTANSTVKFTGAAATLTQDFGLSNLILGSSAASITTATNNVGIGLNALNALTSGSQNTAAGLNAMTLITTGGFNVAIGGGAGDSLTTGSNNVLVGQQSGATMSTGNDNTFIGQSSFQNGVTGSSRNTAIGVATLNSITGVANDNVAIGYRAGFAYTTTESNNILIDNEGVIGESNVIRIGNSHTACYIDGIDGVNVGSVATVVTEFGDQLGTAVLTAGAGITITPGSNTITVTSTAGLVTVNSDSGSATPAAGVFSIVGLSGSKTSASGSTVTIKSPPYSDQAGSTTVTLNSGSFATNAVTLTTPATAGLADGDLLEFVATNGVLTIQLAATQVAHLGSATTTAAGTITGSATGDALCLRYQASTNDWWATSIVGIWTTA